MDAALATALRRLAREGQGAFRFGDAVALGIERVEARRLARTPREWERLRHGIYALAEDVRLRGDDPWELHHLRCAAELLALGFGPVVSHESAADLLRMSHLGEAPERPVVTRERRRRDERTERPGLRLAGLPERHVTSVRGLPVTSPARTAIDLARRDGLVAGVVAADAALQVGASTDELTAVAAHCWHWPGGAAGVEAVRWARPGAESALESGGRFALVGRGAPEPELQVEVWRHGRFVARLDQLWRDRLLAGEADGKVKYLAPWQPRTLLAEKRRQEDVEDCGIAVLRYDWAQAFYRGAELKARWDAKAASSGARRLAAGVELRTATGRRAA